MKMGVIIGVVVLFFIVTLVPVGIGVRLQTGSNDTNRVMEESGDQAVTASSGGVTTKLAYGNVRFMINVLTVGGRTNVLFAPQEPDDGVGVVVSMGSAARIHVVPSGEGDSVLFYFTTGGKTRCYSFVNCKTMANLERTVSPDGVAGPNQVDAGQNGAA